MWSHGTLGAAAGALIALLGACNSASTAPSDVGPAQLLLVKPAAATLKGGQLLRLAVLVQHGTEFTPAPADVTWSSSDATVASVAAEGLVKAARQGTADIVAYWNGMRGVARMTVLAGEAPESPCPSLSVAATGSSLKKATGCKESTGGKLP